MILSLADTLFPEDLHLVLMNRVSTIALNVDLWVVVTTVPAVLYPSRRNHLYLPTEQKDMTQTGQNQLYQCHDLLPGLNADMNFCCR